MQQESKRLIATLKTDHHLWSLELKYIFLFLHLKAGAERSTADKLFPTLGMVKVI